MSLGFGRLNELVDEAHKTASEKGFWDNQDRENTTVILCKLMLITTEVAEAAEAIRHGNEENFKEELADVCIRIFDLAGAKNINLEQEIVNKMEVNYTRPYKHGKLA
jgi:NTP pyrophosphatase (non-canonical NTP hydrolase)